MPFIFHSVISPQHSQHIPARAISPQFRSPGPLPPSLTPMPLVTSPLHVIISTASRLHSEISRTNETMAPLTGKPRLWPRRVSRIRYSFFTASLRPAFTSEHMMGPPWSPQKTTFHPRTTLIGHQTAPGPYETFSCPIATASALCRMSCLNLYFCFHRQKTMGLV